MRRHCRGSHCVLAASSASQGPGLGILARSAWLQRGNTLSLITEMFATDKSQNCELIANPRHSKHHSATCNCVSEPKVRSVGGAQGATQLRWQRRSGLTAHFTALVVTFVRVHTKLMSTSKQLERMGMGRGST